MGWLIVAFVTWSVWVFYKDCGVLLDGGAGFYVTFGALFGIVVFYIAVGWNFLQERWFPEDESEDE